MLLESDQIAGGGLGKRAAGGVLIISRALCRYRHFRTPAGLSSRQIANAAATFSQAHAPYEQTGSLTFRTPLGVGVWFWDQARIAAACGGDAPRAIVPESLLRGAGEGWRVLACEEGFEAQYWEAGALVASTWRRGPFGREYWNAFALGIETPATEPPDALPAATETPLRKGANWRRNRIGAPLNWRDAENALFTLCVCALALAAFFAGQALHRQTAAAADLRASAAMEAQMDQDATHQRVREHLALLRAYHGANSGPDVLGAASEATATLAGFGITPLSWRADAEGLSIAAPGSVNDLPVREIVTALEALESLCNVEPSFAAEEVTFRAVLAGPRRACGAGA
jgi:hypothetical protein